MPLVEGVRKFRAHAHPERADLFAQLENQQRPDVLFITCADSRVDPSLITQTEPGTLFVCRNAGNIVPRWADRPDGMLASVEFAVSVLEVSHAIVCGHSNCGAMGAHADPPVAADLPAVLRWLSEAGITAGEGEPLDDLIARNARTQLENLRTHPSVARAIAMGALELHAWVYDIGSGSIHDVTDDDDVTLIG